MIDSKDLNENASSVETTPQEGAAQNPEAAQSVEHVVAGKVVSIVNEEVKISLESSESDEDNAAFIPVRQFKDGVAVGDTVKIRLEEKNGSTTITEIVSHEKAATSKPSEAQQAVINSDVPNPEEEEHPTDDEPCDDIKATVVAVEKCGVRTDVLLEFRDTKERVTVPQSAIGNFDVEAGYVLNLEIEQVGDKRTIKAAQIHSKPKVEDSVNNADNVEDDTQEEPEDEIKLDYIDKDFLLECMAVPSHSKLEYRMVAFIILWARRNNVKYEFDSFGNIYLTKGELDSGEYYPCVTSHLDTVQTKHDPYIYAGVPLKLKVELTKDKQHKLSVDNEDGNLGSDIGIGADCKSGICICLSLFDHVDKLKACFFLDEETGCNGSDKLDENWFKDVGYVIGFDSPDLYRAAWSCQGTKLFNYEFYEKYMKEVCDTWGLTEGCFFSEPYTDVKNIREKTGIICMNFGNGGYYAHNIGGTEFCIMEDMDQACGMGIDLIDFIGTTRHYLKHRGKTWGTTNTSYIRSNDGTYLRANDDEEDNRKLELLGDRARMRSFGGNNSTSHTSTNTSSSSSSSSTNKPTVSKEDEIKFETVKYIADRYDGHIKAIKEEVLDSVKELCEANGIAFKPFEEAIASKFSNEIKF